MKKMYVVKINGEHVADLDGTEGFDGNVALQVAVMVKALTRKLALKAFVGRVDNCSEATYRIMVPSTLKVLTVTFLAV